MKVCRFILKADVTAKPSLGVMSDDGIRDVTAVTEELPSLRWPLPPGDQVIAALPSLRPRMEALASNAPVIPRSEVNLLSPVANSGKFVCGVGAWKHHDIPLGVLGSLFKMTSATAGESDGVALRWLDRQTVYEAELAWVIDGDKVIGRGANPASCIKTDGSKYAGLDFLKVSIRDVHPSSYSAKERVALMDATGVSAEVVYPNILGFGGQNAARVDDELRLASVQIFNDAARARPSVVLGRGLG